MIQNRPIIGHIRFSYYGQTDTRMQPDEDGITLARLYDETRMAQRFFFFENLTLPSLRAQTDGDFRILLMSSDLMPDRFKTRLAALVAGDPRFTIDFSPHRHGRRAFIGHMRASAGADGQTETVHFRLDDDDALGVGYIARLRAASAPLAVSTHISFPTGLVLFPASADSPEGTLMGERGFLTSQGIATVCGPGYLKNPFQMRHGDVWLRWPIYSDPTLPAFIRTHHLTNDTRDRQDDILAPVRRERFSRRAAAHLARADELLADGFPFLNRAGLESLLGRAAQIRSLADLPDP